jgi:hypothetical protein
MPRHGWAVTFVVRNILASLEQNLNFIFFGEPEKLLLPVFLKLRRAPRENKIVEREGWKAEHYLK